MPDLVRLLARVGARRMGDPGLPVALAEASAAVGDVARDGALRAEAGAALSVALHVFNATGDRDDGGVLGVRRRAAGPREADAFRPLLLKAPGLAWLRIALEAEADATMRTRRGTHAARASAGRERRLLCYRRHAPDASVAGAIAADLTRFANVGSIADACALGVGDACAEDVEATLSASLSLAWEDLVSAAVPAWAGVFGRDAGALLVEVPASAAASLAVSIEDGFSVAIARRRAAGDRAFRVALRRQRRGARTAEASLGVEVAFADPAAVATVLAGVLADWLDVPADALQAIRRATSLEAVPARHRPVVDALADRFGLDDAAPLARVRARLEELDARFAGALESLARTRAAVQVGIAYRRLASDAVLLEAELSEAGLRRLHPALLALDTGAVLADRGPGVAAVSLLHDRVVERARSWRVGASLGDWFALSGSQQREDRWLERRRVDADGDRTRREYAGATRYAARANGWSTAFGASFEAVEDGSGAGPSCALAWSWEEARLRADPDGLARIVDDAVLWGVVDAGAAPALHARLRAALAGVGRCRPCFERSLEGDAVRGALQRLGAASHADWSLHAARALPRNPRIVARADCTARGAAYGPVFTALGASDGTVTRRQLAALLQDADPRLAARERKGNTPWTAWRVLQQAGMVRAGPARAWRGFAGGAAALARATAIEPAAASAGHDAVAQAFALLRPAFEQPFTLRTVGSLLADVAGGGAVLRLAFVRDGEPRSLVVAA